MLFTRSYSCIVLWILLAPPAIVYGQSYSCIMDLPYVQDFDGFTYRTPMAGSAVDMTLVTEANCWTQYIYRSIYTVCSMIAPNHTGSGNHALWLYADKPMAGQRDRVEYTYTVSPPFRNRPTVISFDVQYIWYDSVGHFGTPDSLPWHAGVLQMGYVTDESDPENNYFPIANIVIDTAAWFSGNTANTDSWQHYRLDLRTRYATLPAIRCLAFKPICNMDSIGTVQIFIDNLHVADEMDTVDYRDTICSRQPYSGYGFTIDSTETSTPGLHVFSRERLESHGMVHYRLSLWVPEVADTEMESILVHGDTLRFLDSMIVAPGSYRFTLTSSLGCDSLVILNVSAAEVGLSFSAERVCPGEEVTLCVEGMRNVRWNSEPYDRSLDSLQGQPCIVVHPKVPTVYQLLDTAGDVCVSQSVAMENCSGLWIPNVFTPDAETNRLFGVQASVPVEEFRMTLYTRTGLLVWESNGISEHWDGTRNGCPMPQGAYAYHWELKSQGLVYTGIGTVLLLR